MFDGIEYRGFAQDSVETLATFSGVPVWNGLTDQWHPTQMLADILTMRDHTHKPLDRVAYCYLGDARNNTANSLLVTGALLGMDVRIAAPKDLWPSSEVQTIASKLAATSGARINIGDDVARRGERSRLPLHRCLGIDGRACLGLEGQDRPAACPTRSTRRS